MKNPSRSAVVRRAGVRGEQHRNQRRKGKAGKDVYLGDVRPTSDEIHAPARIAGTQALE